MLMEPQSLDDLSAEQLREMTTRLLAELRHSQALNAKLIHENALLKRMKFAAQSERFNAEQRSLLDDEIEADPAAVAIEIEQLQPPAAAPEAKQQPKRQPLPAHLPRREIRHEPASTTCTCGCHDATLAYPVHIFYSRSLPSEITPSGHAVAVIPLSSFAIASTNAGSTSSDVASGSRRLSVLSHIPMDLKVTTIPSDWFNEASVCSLEIRKRNA